MAEPSDEELLRILDTLEGFSAEALDRARRKQEEEARTGAFPRTLLEILMDDGGLDAVSRKLLLEAARPDDPTKVLAPGPGLRLGPRASRPPEVEVAARDPERRYGAFVAVAEVGRGGMGCVWKAWDEQVGRWVALKVLEGGDPDSRERFVREAQIAGRLAHPNIAAVFHAGEERGRGWIALQFIEGAPVDAAPTPVETALRRVRDAARALAYAHEQGVVHRDVKPGNLLVDRGGRVFLTDFGLAKESSSKHGAPLSITGAVLGTPQFMAPEQARGDRKAVGPRSDVYSLGATLYALLAGRPPFGGSDVAALLVSVAERRPAPVRKHNPRVSPELQMALERAMAKRPEDRYPSAAAFADELDRLLREKRFEGRYGLARLLFRQWAPWVAAAALAGAALRFALPVLLAPPADLAPLRDEAAELYREASVGLALVETRPPEERAAAIDADFLPRLARVLALRPGHAGARVLRARALAVSGRAPEARLELPALDGLPDYRVPFLRALLGLDDALAAPPPLPQTEGPAFAWEREPAPPDGPWVADLRRALQASSRPEQAEEARRDAAALDGLLALAEGRWAEAAEHLSRLRRSPPVPAVRRAWARASYLARRFPELGDAVDAPRERLGAALAGARSVEDLERALALAAGDAASEDAVLVTLARRALDAGLDPGRWAKAAGAEAAAVVEVARLRRLALSGRDEEAAWRKAIAALPKAPSTWAGRLAAAEARLGLGTHLAARGADGRPALEEAVSLADALGRGASGWPPPRVLRAAAKRGLGRPDDALAEIEGLSDSVPALVQAAWIAVAQAERERKAGRSGAEFCRAARRRAVEAGRLAPGHPEALAAAAAGAVGLVHEGVEPSLLGAAGEELDRALAAAPGCLEALFVRARAGFLRADAARRAGGDGRAESAAAESDLGSILNVLPRHRPALHLRGVARFGVGDYDGALADWRALVAADASWDGPELREWMRHAEERRTGRGKE
jgi:hypothetical protein